MYKCLECYRVFDEPNEWEEYRGECFGFPSYETMSGCPHCGGDYEEMFECEICGDNYLEDDLIEGICEDCLGKSSKDFELGKKFGEENKYEVEINGLLTVLFSDDEIEEILFKYIDEYQLRNRAMEALLIDNKSEFAEYVRELHQNEKEG